MRNGTRITWAATLAAVASFLVFQSAPGGEETPGSKVPEVAVAQARERAKLMHDVCASTLDVMHHHFFKPNYPVLPARAMEDMFADVARRSKIQARWLAINTKAMSIDHEPKSDFDRKAAAALSAGETSYEQVRDGILHRVASIPLNGGCVSCHAGLFPQKTKAPRVAGLVVSVPLLTK